MKFQMFLMLVCSILQAQPTNGQNQLSLVTRYAGMGYNILEANPEGDFYRGGIDPGVKTTRFIFEHTYTRGKLVYYRGSSMTIPDQVAFHMTNSCTTSSNYNAYSGQTSYRNELSRSIETSASATFASLLSVKFSTSAAMSTVETNIRNYNKVVVQATSICNYGQARYKLSNALSGVSGYNLTEDFMNAVRLLPSTYSSVAYTRFIDDWGTHIIETVSVGTRYNSRKTATYFQVYEYLKNQVELNNNNGVTFSANFIHLNITTTSQIVNQRAVENIGVSYTTSTVGSAAVPMPIHIKIVPISDALANNLWNTSERAMIGQKKTHLTRALRDYAENKNAQIATDPLMQIRLEWPYGTYSLIQSASGCPSGWSSGWRHQDNEDSNNANSWSPSNLNSYAKIELGRNIKTHYCTKIFSSNTGFTWPSGTYCIARYGNTCPSGFSTGYREWDDEDSRNANGYSGILPDGTYGRNTLIQYCCRTDGNPSNHIILPTNTPFVLYRYGGVCQKVRGMNNPTYLSIHFDDEDSRNANSCQGSYPDGACGRNHDVNFCYYNQVLLGNFVKHYLDLYSELHLHNTHMHSCVKHYLDLYSELHLHNTHMHSCV